MSWLRAVLPAVMIAALVTGCASHGGADLVPGSSTAAYVEASMGPPAERMTLANGDTQWFYPKQPYGRVSYAVVIGPDNIVRSVEQRLTEANMQRITIGKSSTNDVRVLFGPPNQVLRYPYRDGDSWEYNMHGGPIDDWKILSIRFDAAGLVQDISYVDDPSNPRLQPGNGFWFSFGL